ncbi:hypothetical protein IWX85_000180 [Polaromonas sp. CG_9.11]|nr:hypothetical protein [Polaromonas sp. CG_9.11]
MRLPCGAGAALKARGFWRCKERIDREFVVRYAV